VSEGARVGTAVVLKESDKAILVKMDESGTECWIPKSQIHEDSEVYKDGTTGELVVSQWLAEKNGWA
jgi:hypothetical protein